MLSESIRIYYIVKEILREAGALFVSLGEAGLAAVIRVLDDLCLARAGILAVEHDLGFGIGITVLHPLEV